MIRVGKGRDYGRGSQREFRDCLEFVSMLSVA